MICGRGSLLLAQTVTVWPFVPDFSTRSLAFAMSAAVGDFAGSPYGHGSSFL